MSSQDVKEEKKSPPRPDKPPSPVAKPKSAGSSSFPRDLYRIYCPCSCVSGQLKKKYDSRANAEEYLKWHLMDSDKPGHSLIEPDAEALVENRADCIVHEVVEWKAEWGLPGTDDDGKANPHAAAKATAKNFTPKLPAMAPKQPRGPPPASAVRRDDRDDRHDRDDRRGDRRGDHRGDRRGDRRDRRDEVHLRERSRSRSRASKWSSKAISGRDYGRDRSVSRSPLPPTSKHHGVRQPSSGSATVTSANLQSMERTAAALLDVVGNVQHQMQNSQLALPDDTTQKQKIADFAKAGI